MEYANKNQISMKVNQIINSTPCTTEYLPYRNNILSVMLTRQTELSIHPDGGGAYPVIYELYDDGTIKEFEIFTRLSSWNVNFGLQAPSDYLEGDVVISEENETIGTPVFWINDCYEVLFIELMNDIKSEVRHIKISDKVIIALDKGQRVTGLWFLDLPAEIRRKRPTQGLLLYDFSENTRCSLSNMEQAAKGREEALRFALSHKLSPESLCHKMKELNDKRVYLPIKSALVPDPANHPDCQNYRQGYLNALIDTHQLLAKQNGSLDATFSVVRQEMFYVRGQKEAARLAYESQGRAYKLQIAIEETKQDLQSPPNIYAETYKSSYLSGLKDALKLISSRNKVENTDWEQ